MVFTFVIEYRIDLQIVAWGYINNITPSSMRYLLTIDQNGKIIEKVDLNGIQRTSDAIFINNKIIATVYNKLKTFE